jgi:hypothetical protein
VLRGGAGAFHRQRKGRRAQHRGAQHGWRRQGVPRCVYCTHTEAARAAHGECVCREHAAKLEKKSAGARRTRKVERRTCADLLHLASAHLLAVIP